jgi:hypothetical protein
VPQTRKAGRWRAIAMIAMIATQKKKATVLKQAPLSENPSPSGRTPPNPPNLLHEKRHSPLWARGANVRQSCKFCTVGLTALGAWGKFDNLSVFVLTPLGARGQQRGLKQAPNRPLWARGGKSDNVSVFVLTPLGARWLSVNGSQIAPDPSGRAFRVVSGEFPRY